MTDTPPRRFGGTDIAKLLGMSKYGNAADVYERVWGLSEDEWTPPMERGAMVEPQLRAHAQRLFGVELEDMASEYVESAAHPFAWAQVDDLARWNGVPVVMEYKSQSQFAKGWAHPDTIPEQYAAQVAWQLMCTERELALVVVGFGQDTPGGGFDIHNVTHFEVERDLAFERYFLQVAKDFWETHILRRVPPDMKPLGKKSAA